MTSKYPFSMAKYFCSSGPLLFTLEEKTVNRTGPRLDLCPLRLKLKDCSAPHAAPNFGCNRLTFLVRLARILTNALNKAGIIIGQWAVYFIRCLCMCQILVHNSQLPTVSSRMFWSLSWQAFSWSAPAPWSSRTPDCCRTFPMSTKESPLWGVSGLCRSSMRYSTWSTSSSQSWTLLRGKSRK